MMKPVKPYCLPALSGLLGMLAATMPAFAQTDYYNTDAGRPLQIEDAHPVERRAFEIQAAPVRLERSRGGSYHWGIEPEVAYGILPRTQVEVGFPIAFIDGGDGSSTAGLAGVDVSVLHNLNAETAIPAFALGAAVALPVGSLATDEAHASIKAIMTRTFTWARFHINAQYTLSEALPSLADIPEGGHVQSADEELSRWLGGIAIDRALPLHSMLLAGEVYAREPLRSGEPVEWNAGIGTRYQVSPRIAIDAGIGRQLTGDEQAWHATFGAALAVGLPWYP